MYIEKIQALIQKIKKQERSSMQEAAQQIAQAIKNGKIIHLFGSGHSHMLAEELFYRAGGLVPVNPILHEPLMLHEHPVKSSLLEREENYAESFMANHQLNDGDILFVISTSGRNAVPIEIAELGKAKGVFVIGLTSVSASSKQSSRHSSGKRLFEVVDHVVDTHVPFGDALIQHEKVSTRFASSSTVLGAIILNAIIADAIHMLADDGLKPPIFLSGNIEGGDQHNNELVKQYSDRIPLLRLASE